MPGQRSCYEPIFSCLRSNNFHFSETWVIECVNYLKAAKAGIPLEVLKNEVKQQWLSLNLRDVKVPSLPPDLKSKQEVIISGNYAVQVESMIDSSRSCYSQFQKLLNADPDHIEAKEENENSNRCLTFLLSDGVQEVHAMEYEIIKTIRTNDPKLRPGFKMVIMGPVECRKGMILLKDRNVRLCGGGVDAFALTNSLKSILIRRLELDAADYPEVTSDNVEENEISQPPSNEMVSVDNFDDDFVESLLSQDDDVFFNIPLQPVNHERQSQETFSTSSQTNSSLLQADTLTTGGILLDSTLDNSGRSLHMTHNLIEVDKSDIFTEECPQLQTRPQISDLKSRKPVQTTLSSFLKNNKPSVSSANILVNNKKETTFISEKPFVYLKHIMSVKLSKPTVFMIKAIILTLKKKLTIEKNEYKLKAHITDGSSSIDVDFCSEILETLLGYSPCEMTVMVKAKQTNSAIASRVKESFSKAQEKLICLNCLMEIKFFTNGESPLILSLQEVTNQTLRALKERMLVT